MGASARTCAQLCARHGGSGQREGLAAHSAQGAPGGKRVSRTPCLWLQLAARPVGALASSHLGPRAHAPSGGLWRTGSQEDRVRVPLGTQHSSALTAAPWPCFVAFACSIQDIAILFNIIIIFLMFFNTFVFQAGLVSLLFHKFKGTIVLTAVYFALSIALHVWVMNLRWKDSNRFVWTEGLQTLFVSQRLAAVLYCYFYKRTAVRLGDPRFYQDSVWLRKEFTQVRR
ncbi:transmembrane protein 138 isoform X2 [Myotis yumanensis]